MLKISTAATLTRYAQRFAERCERYPRAWHICVVAEDRCSSEFLPAERRRQERFHEIHPNMSAHEVDMPWNVVFKEATDNMDFWSTTLQEPALLYSSTRWLQGPSWNT